MKAYDEDLRKKVLDLIDKGYKKVAIYPLLGLSNSTVFRWIRLKKETGHLKPQVRENKPRKINYEQLQERVKAQPDHTVSELAEHFNMSRSGIWSAMGKLDFTRKKSLRFTKKLSQNNGKNLSTQ